MALSHYKNSHAASKKWEVVNPALFEITIIPPAAVTDDLTTTLFLEHVRNIDGLDGLNPNIGTAVQKFKQAERHYAGGPDSTHLDLNVLFSLNLNDSNENYIYTSIRKWRDLVWNPANGAAGLKKEYAGTMIIVEYNRDGSVWRKITCADVFPTGQPTGMGNKNYDGINEASELSVPFICDVWDEKTVGLPIYE